MRSPAWGAARGGTAIAICLFLLILGCGGDVDREPELPAIIDVWDHADAAGSRTRFEQLARQAGGAGSDIYRAEVLTQVARCQGLQGEYDEAQATLDGVSASQAAQHPRVRLRIALEGGRVLRSSGDPAAARPLFERAWKLGRESGEDFLACDAAHMVALVAPLEEAAVWTAQARELARSSADETSQHWLGPLHNNLGWAYYEVEAYDSALTQFELSYEGYRQRPEKEAEELIARYAIGKALRALGRSREAVETQNRVRLAFEARGENDGYVHEELAEGYLALGREREGCEAARRAFEILSRDGWFVENEPERLERMRALGAKCP